MRICLVSREYPPFYGGGIGTYASQFSSALAAAGHTVVVLTVGADSPQERTRDGNCTIIRIPLVKGDDWSAPHPAIDCPPIRAAFNTFSPVSIFAMQAAAALPALHHEFAFDIVEAPDTGALAWFLLNNRRSGGPWADSGPPIMTCIHSPSDWIAQYNRTPIQSRRDQELVAMEHESLRWSDSLVCPSFAVARWTEQHCGLAADSVTVIPHCLGDLEPIAIARAASNSPAMTATTGPRRILFASRLEPRKGVDTLMAGLVIALERDADLHLDLAGQDTPDPGGRGQFGENSFRALVPSRFRGRITFHGKLPPQRIAEMQASAHAVAIPAPMDNFPYACMEAMAHGRIIIAARAGGMQQMIEHGTSGLLFEPGSAESCAEALLKVASLSPEAAETLGRGAARRILDVCGNQHILDRRLDHYREAIDQRRTQLETASARTPKQVVVVNRDGLADERRLRDAVEAGWCDFAHGWMQNAAGEIVACSSPTLDGPALAHAGAGYPGPLVLSAAAARHAAIAPMLRPGTGVDLRCTDGRSLVRALLEAGFLGSVIPEVISVVPGVQPPPTPRPAARLPAVRAIRAILRTVRK